MQCEGQMRSIESRTDTNGVGIPLTTANFLGTQRGRTGGKLIKNDGLGWGSLARHLLLWNTCRSMCPRIGPSFIAFFQ